MQRGYIKIWRKLEDSGLLQMHSTLAMFMYMLIKASYKPCRIGMVDLDRGQLCSGRFKLAEALELSEQSVRTCLSNLHELGMITSKSTNKFTIYTIVNYGQYQDVDDSINQQVNQQSTSNQPTTNQQLTTIKEVNTLSIKNNTSASCDKSHSAKLTFDFEKSAWLNVNGEVSLWSKAYPAINVKAEMDKAAAWLAANPKNKKSNYTRFLNGWMSRAQDRARPTGEPQPKKAWE